MGDVFRIGVSEVDITPPVGLPMDGYMARAGVSTGVHDPLLAQILVLDNGDARAALVTLDVMGVSTSFTGPLRSSLAAVIGTTPNAILICASHTHAGPAGLQDWFPVGEKPPLNSQIVGLITSQLTNAVHTALDQLTPARLSYGMGSVEHIGTDRNKHTPALDPLVTALRFDKMDGTPLAVVFHYACHPTVLGPQLQYSADFPGAARRKIQTRYPVALFLNGAAGNISTRFTRRDQSFDEVDRLGSLLGSRVIALLDASQPSATTLRVSSRIVDLPLRKFAAEPAHNFESSGNQRIDQTRTEGAIIEGELAHKFKDQSVLQAELCALYIGPFSLLSIPGEAFNEMAADLRRMSPTALVVGYTNDYLGYFPTQQAIDDQTYEALSSPYDARAHTLLRDALLTLVLDNQGHA